MKVKIKKNQCSSGNKTASSYVVMIFHHYTYTCVSMYVCTRKLLIQRTSEVCTLNLPPTDSSKPLHKIQNEKNKNKNENNKGRHNNIS